MYREPDPEPPKELVDAERLVESLTAMAGQSESPREAEIASRKLSRAKAKLEEIRAKFPDRPAGRKTAQRPPDYHTTSGANSTGWVFTDDEFFEDIDKAFSTPGRSARTMSSARNAPPCPLCKHKHARTGTFCAVCSMMGREDCEAFYGDDGWATLDKGPLDGSSNQ